MSTELDTLFDKFDQAESEVQAPAAASAEATQSQAVSTVAKAPKEKYAKSMLFVRGIPKDATNQELEEYFSNIGPVRSCFVVGEKKPEAPAKADKDAETKDDTKDDGSTEPADAKGNEPKKDDDDSAKVVPVKNRGFGFVQFVLPEDAVRAVAELAEVKFRGTKRLMFDFAIRKNAQDGEEVSKPAATPAKRTRLEPPGKPLTTERPAKKPKPPSGTKVESRTIVISNIPKGVTKKALVKKVKKSGDPHSVFYPIPFDGASEEELQDGAGGSAYVTYDDHSTAQRALKALNNHIFKGAKLTVKLKTEYLDKNARLIVRNLPFKVRERELENLFSASGTVLKVDLPRKFTGGPLRGFAFVQMGDYESAERAIAKWNSHDLQGRVITVALAVAKDKFKEMEENGEIERPNFHGDDSNEDSDVEMASGDDNVDSGEDDDAEHGSDAASDQDLEGKDVDDMEDSDSEPNDVVDESLQEGCTLFIRNLSFDSDEDGLFELFKAFGKLRYCRIVYDSYTGKSRGTAFVCFWKSSDAASCLELAQKAQALSEKLSSVPSSMLPDQRNKSVLLQEAPSKLDATSQFSLDGRMLSIARAVDRNTAHDLATEGLQKRKSKDNRNAYLLKEGIVFPDTPAATHMAPTDLEHHVKEYGVRKNQIYKNPNLYLSKTRLTVHNLPRAVDDAALRTAAISAIGKFKQEVKDKARQPLSQDEMSEGWDKRPHVSQAKIVRSVDRVDVATGKARSKGYGFIEFSTHAHALACLRYLNFRNTAQSFSKDLIDDDEPEGVENKSAYKISRRSLRVMFAIENAQVVKKRELRFTLAAKHRASKEAHDGTAQPARPSSSRGGSARGKPSKGGSRAEKKHASKGGRADKGHASKGKSFGVQSSSRRNGGKEDSKSGRSKHGGKQQK
ncbi:RNA recognition motif-containing protein [Coemansia sp. RSA 2322]|uniref:RNA recognition motif-containing protein n=1 Tax=Coemansia thaxteri TaxID=2663907 RepID=A0A9W8BAK4_9FUNG|nr:RNA recognition motif-containing protein [Coemansia thaxteri]KAJ2472816.1 RNA recognition motif-containing protein [Coemansia sp. RSA 2322]KAJ2481652.1 RNA recognition motif-containing protein [Coemansia sp. RSA 2320]